MISFMKTGIRLNSAMRAARASAAARTARRFVDVPAVEHAFGCSPSRPPRRWQPTAGGGAAAAVAAARRRLRDVSTSTLGHAGLEHFRGFPADQQALDLFDLGVVVAGRAFVQFA